MMKSLVLSLLLACPLVACATGGESDTPHPTTDAAFDSKVRNNGGDSSGLDVSYDLGVHDADGGVLFDAGGETSVDADAPTGCPSGTTRCGALCLDITKDPKNCGGCGKACKSGELCASSSCIPECSGGTTKCGASCVDTSRDSANCGSCGKACAVGEACVAGACTLVCSGGTTKCGSSCVTTASDPSNCGACGVVCAAGSVCSGGSCTVVCGPGTTKCGASCTDTNTDPSNCGSCGVVCPTGQTCVGGACTLVCSGGTTKCGASCVSVATDPSNCGGCGVACASGPHSTPICSGGTCKLSCDAGWGDCNGIASDGCETDLSVDNNNCGACGAVCAACTTCGASTCSATTSAFGFPSTTSTTIDGTLGAGGGGRYWHAGDYVQQTFTRAVCTTAMDVDFNMSDFTDNFGCAVASPLRFNILLNGVIVGNYNFPGGTGGPFGTSWHVKGTIPYAAVAPSSGAFTLRFEALDTVCAGGGSWDWVSTGSVTLR